MSFAGFPAETLDFLVRLRENNTRSWFEAHRDDYARWYVEPAMAFVVAAGAALRGFAPDVRAEPRILGSIFRINRDIRFSRDKRPYKDHLDFWFWEGERKTAVSGFFVRVSPDLVGMGAGCHGFSPGQRSMFERAASAPGGRAELEAIASTLAAAGYQLSAEPTPRARGLYVHVDAPPAEALTARLVDSCARHWRSLAPLHRWLVDRVQLPLAASA